jgi:hypothetical protein
MSYSFIGLTFCLDGPQMSRAVSQVGGEHALESHRQLEPALAFFGGKCRVFRSILLTLLRLPVTNPQIFAQLRFAALLNSI